MYASHFGLRAEPFSLTPDPSSFYMTPGYAEAFAALDVGLRNRSGLIVLTGEPGIGKTTLVYSILSQLGPEVRTAYVSNTSVSFDEMLRQILADFGVRCGHVGRFELLQALNTFLMECATEGALVAVVIDEAQNLNREALESVRLLSNYETFTAKLLQIVLVGQPELDAKLGSPGLHQLASRVAVRCRLKPLTAVEGRRYVEYRLHGVGGSLDLFSPRALSTVLRAAGGIPRRINILCQDALLFAFGRGAHTVSRPLARAVARAHAPKRWSAGRESGVLAAAPPTRPHPALTLAGLIATTVGALVLVLVVSMIAGGGPTLAPNPPAAVSVAFPTTLAVEVDFAEHAAPNPGAAASTRLHVDPNTTQAPEEESIAAWMQLALAVAAVALAAGSTVVLVGLRRTHSAGWGLA